MQILKAIFLLVLFTTALQGQTLIQMAGEGPPSGACTSAAYVNLLTGDNYKCENGSYVSAFTAVPNTRTINGQPLSSNVTISTGTLPPGLIVISLTPCAVGFTEVSALAGKTLFGTTAANGDVGTTGGSDTLTPEGTVSEITQTIDHVHQVNVTDPGHTHLTQRYPTATGPSSGFTIDTSMNGTPTDNTLPVKASTTGISAVTVNPVGGVASIQPTFSGVQADNRSAFLKVIFCSKD